MRRKEGRGLLGSPPDQRGPVVERKLAHAQLGTQRARTRKREAESLWLRGIQLFEARARLLAEATLAWIDARDYQQAEGSILAAKRLAPDLPELDFVAAKAYAAAGKWQAAADAVTAAEDAGLKAIEAYLIRARAQRALGKDMDAAQDVVAALTIDPYNIDALTLRGELQQAGIEIEAYYGDEKDRD